MGHNARVWYPISDLLHLRNDVLIGYAYIARGESLCFYENLYHAYRSVNSAPIYPTLIDQSDELVMTYVQQVLVLVINSRASKEYTLEC